MIFPVLNYYCGFGGLLKAIESKFGLTEGSMSKASSSNGFSPLHSLSGPVVDLATSSSSSGVGLGTVGTHHHHAMEDNSLSVMAGSEPPGLNTDTLDSVRAACM